MEKVGNVQEQMDNVTKKIEILKKTHTEMLEIRNITTEMKNVSHRFISRLDITKERLSLRTCQQICPTLKSKGKKRLKNGQNIQNHGIITKDVTCDMGIPEGKEREKHIEEIFEAIMTENFSQINVRQNTNPGKTWRI